MSDYVLGIVDYFEVGGFACIVTKYEAGGDLNDYQVAFGNINFTEEHSHHIFV